MASWGARARGRVLGFDLAAAATWDRVAAATGEQRLAEAVSRRHESTGRGVWFALEARRRQLAAVTH